MELIIALEIPGRLPSWNEIIGMNRFTYTKFKRAQQDAFLSALYRSANAFSTRTTSQKKLLSTAAATLGSWILTHRKKRGSKRHNASAGRARRRKP